MNGICGLGNIGNTCYINATLQILAQMDELNNYLTCRQNLRNLHDSVLVFEWIQLFAMIQKNHCSIVPGRFIERMRQVAHKKNRPEFSSPQQNDSIDYFEFMLDCIHLSLENLDPSLILSSRCKEVQGYLSDSIKKSHSIIPQLFQSCTLYQYRNPINKEKEFYKIEHDYRIGVSIPDRDHVTLYDCLKETFRDELMDGDNAWYDEKNKIKKTVYKQTALCHMPTYLVLHLKRWRDDLSKKNACIETPILLDMMPFTLYPEPCHYKLFGIINHDGDIDRGHYYAYVHKNEQWFSLNDGFIQTIPESSLFHSGNYCLFYRKIK